jgi:hypothetical protein
LNEGTRQGMVGCDVLPSIYGLAAEQMISGSRCPLPN